MTVPRCYWLLGELFDHCYLIGSVMNLLFHRKPMLLSFTKEFILHGLSRWTSLMINIYNVFNSSIEMQWDRRGQKNSGWNVGNDVLIKKITLEPSQMISMPHIFSAFFSFYQRLSWIIDNNINIMKKRGNCNSNGRHEEQNIIISWESFFLEHFLLCVLTSS
jgi:hypothetical protein